jgi:hypothetical protein
MRHLGDLEFLVLEAGSSGPQAIDLVLSAVLCLGGVNYPLGASGTGNEHVPLAGIDHSLPLCYSTA